MTPEAIRLVRQSFRRLLPEADRLVVAVFARAAATAPVGAAPFRPRTAEERRRLIAMAAFAIKALDDFDEIRPTLAAAGGACRDRGVTAAHYMHFGTTLLETLEREHAPDWTAELEAAWAEVFGAIALAMRAGTATRPAAA